MRNPIALTGLLAILVWSSGALSSADEPLFTFVQISDAHVGNPANLPEHKRLIAAVRLANLLEPDFVIDTGDLTSSPVYEASPENLAEYDQYKEYVAPLKMPLYTVPGNHDIGYWRTEGRTRKGGKPWGDYDELVEAYKEKMGPLDQSFTHKGIHFILFNFNPPMSREPGHLTEEQFAWIEAELEQSETAFLFCHVQLLKNGEGPVWGDSARRLVALIREHNVAAVAYGHQHQLHNVTLHGTQYIMCPDLKVPDHQSICQYRVYSDHFDLWLYDVFSHEGTQLGSYPYPRAAVAAE